MSLTELWLKSREQLEHKHVQQVIAFAGDGKLRDIGSASPEFREFLAKVPSEHLARYASECLIESFSDSGSALQDVVNELGRRLGFQVLHGRYRGATGHIGNDGLWTASGGLALIVEVKTTDAYRVDLDAIAEYRKKLIAGGKVLEDKSSILIVVGRQDTGGLEAQIRGSHHAWDIRLISVDSLVRLVRVKESVEAPASVNRIHDVLVPREYTRVDGIVDLLFSAAEDIKLDEEAELEEDLPPDIPSGSTEDGDGTDEQPAKRFTPVAFHKACVDQIMEWLKEPLVKKSRATYASANEDLRLVCAVSREYVKKDGAGYWFAFHPHQQEFLAGGQKSFVALGCGSPAQLLLVPFREFEAWLPWLNVTESEDRMHWHVHVHKHGVQLELVPKVGFAKVPLGQYLLS